MTIPLKSPGQEREPSPRIFVSYSHFDYKPSVRLCEMLKHLAGVLDIEEQVAWPDKVEATYYKALDKLCEKHKKEPIPIDVWIDHQDLKGGQRWKDEIQAAMRNADTFIVLLSDRYANSRFCRDIELRYILQRQVDIDAVVIGIALHEINLDHFYVKYEDDLRLDVSGFQCLPQGQIEREKKYGLKPISMWGNKENAWSQIKTELGNSLKTPKLIRTPKLDPALKPANAIATNSPSPFDIDYLPYLCDRGKQSIELKRSLTSWTQQKRPVVVLTEGRLIDSLDGWLDRMHRQELTEHLCLADAESTFGQIKMFEWTNGSVSITDAAEWFIYEISGRLGLKGADRNLATLIATQQKSGMPTLWATECVEPASSAKSVSVLEGLLELLRQWPAASGGGMLVIALNLVRANDAEPGGRAQLGAKFEKALRSADNAGYITFAGLGSLQELTLSEMKTWAADDRVRPKLQLQAEQIHGVLADFKLTFPMQNFVDRARAKLA